MLRPTPAANNDMTPLTDVQQVLAYHEETKHHPHRYARSIGHLDWASQPNPFRSWEGTEVIRLPLLERDPDIPYEHLYERGARTAGQFNVQNLGAFLELSMAISAWKRSEGTQWALRVNPSSGNLHPTEAYLVLPSIEGLTAGVFHYNPFLHALERRVSLPRSLDKVCKEHFQADGFLMLLTTIYWRESWKYGERGFRYCHHDAGHALAACAVSGNLLGWDSTVLSGASDEEAMSVLGFDKQAWIRHEEEHPDAIMYMHVGSTKRVSQDLPPSLLTHCRSSAFTGTPNTLSSAHVDWDVIDRTASATLKPRTPAGKLHLPDHRTSFRVPYLFSAIQVIRKRRSAVAFDGQTSITKEQFFAMLERTLPRAAMAPFDVGLGEAAVHLFLFVHRVVDLDPGLYVFIRHDRDLESLRGKGHSDFAWTRVEKTLPLYFLKAGDFRDTATAVSCGQDIAGESAFSLGQIARFREEVDKKPYRYRHLFWETGMVGQVLYLEAEALGVRATGMGCFFDDSVHQLFGLHDDSFQSLYHFTVGGPVEDARLATLSAYQHLSAHA